MTDIAREALEAERAKLVADNQRATAWGAAIGARSERINRIDAELARMIERENIQVPSEHVNGPLGGMQLWPDILDTPEQRALIEKHNADFHRKYPGLVEIEMGKDGEGSSGE